MLAGKYEAALICAEKAMRKLVKMNQSEKEVAEKATGGQVDILVCLTLCNPACWQLESFNHETDEQLCMLRHVQ